MRFWSKGLGERELIIDLSKGNLTWEEGNVFMRGVIVEPVAWKYEVVLFNYDVRGILRIAISLQGIAYFLRNIAGVFTFINRLLIKRDMGLKPAEAKPAETKPAESAGS